MSNTDIRHTATPETVQVIIDGQAVPFATKGLSVSAIEYAVQKYSWELQALRREREAKASAKEKRAKRTKVVNALKKAGLRVERLDEYDRYADVEVSRNPDAEGRFIVSVNARKEPLPIVVKLLSLTGAVTVSETIETNYSGNYVRTYRATIHETEES